MQGPKRCRGSMSQGSVGPHLPLTWARFDYQSVPVPSTAGGARATALLPALMVRARPASTPPGLGRRNIRARAQLDTGADLSAVPMWMLEELAIPLDKKTRRQIYSVSGKLWAYAVKLGMEIRCGGTWLDIGEAEVLVPDTPWSRDPDSRRPILLGLNGFFDRVRMCIDHLSKTFWIGPPAAAGGAAGGSYAVRQGCAPPGPAAW